MFFVIFSIYIDSFNFVRKNIFLILLMLGANLISDLIREFSLREFSLTPFNIIFWVFSVFFIPSFVNIYLIIFILKSAKFMFEDKPIMEIINKYYKNAVLVYIIGSFFWLLMAGAVIGFYILFFGDLKNTNSVGVHIAGVFFSFFTFIGISLPIISMVLKNLRPVKTFISAFNEFQTHFYYYFLVFSFGIVLKFFPSLIAPIGLAYAPVSQIVEYNLNKQINIFTQILFIFLEIWIFTALVYAVLYKNYDFQSKT